MPTNLRSRRRSHPPGLRQAKEGSAPQVPPQLVIERRGADEGLVLALAGELDLAVAPALEAALLTVERVEHDRLVLDLCGLSFIDCPGLQAPSAVAMRSRRAGTRPLIMGAHGQVKRLLTLAAFDRSLLDLLPAADSTLAA